MIQRYQHITVYVSPEQHDKEISWRERLGWELCGATNSFSGSGYLLYFKHPVGEALEKEE